MPTNWINLKKSKDQGTFYSEKGLPYRSPKAKSPCTPFNHHDERKTSYEKLSRLMTFSSDGVSSMISKSHVRKLLICVVVSTLAPEHVYIYIYIYQGALFVADV